VTNSIDFPVMLFEVEQTGRACFVSVGNGFLGKQKAENYRELVDGLVDAHHKMGCSMLLKVHVPRAHLDKLKDNIGDYPKGQGERFHQNVRSFEEHYNRQYNELVVGDYR